ncbi:DUF3247 family protein [Luteimonas suaedae]|uniref:DUF3247 family protein n=1 Tax=Luteimonas suaedae TaxID=2605430 RepID=UPI0011EC1419|nr:DUF3247 family protein [Luteimonas suaedae]
MGQFAEQVYTRQEDIARIEASATQLHDEAWVALTLEDGGTVEGVVAVRPVVQTFRDPQGREGINAVVRIDDAGDQAVAHYIWLDRIREIRHLGSS